MPRRLLSKIKSKIVKAGRRDKSKTEFPNLAMLGRMCFGPYKILSLLLLAQQQGVAYIQGGVIARICPMDGYGVLSRFEIEAPPYLMTAAVPVGRHGESVNLAAVHLDLDPGLVEFVLAAYVTAYDYALAVGRYSSTRCADAGRSVCARRGEGRRNSVHTLRDAVSVYV